MYCNLSCNSSKRVYFQTTSPIYMKSIEIIHSTYSTLVNIFFKKITANKLSIFLNNKRSNFHADPVQHKET